ncbi:FAD binding domain-containing protein [Mycena metata]|uniref:FAD binding domain-containing protein n=1 Tax=Mycena metata TaxID=1033252 RepID=A0AAD7HRD2_9AGAR|nr:FAD binding domain-containing protein [Mycena metata]
MSDSEPKCVDVLVVGGGPTSLLLTSLLVRSGHKILTVEQYNKFEQGLYGRACMLYAGSLEILDLVGIYERVADIGFRVQNAVTYRDGVQSSSRGWSFVQAVLAESDTMFKYSFSLRQKYLEDVLRDLIQEMDPSVVKAPAKLMNYRTVDSPRHPIVATIEHEGEIQEVHCKYIVGADGGRSTVRKLGNFAFPGTASPHKWVRLDAVVKTDMPLSQTHAISIESKIYGNVLWTPTDNGRTRIGFVYDQPPGTQVTEDLIMAAAKQAVHPFTLEFVLLEWWTVYEIGQHIVDTFRQGPVFLAGDAAHTHSSGAAQGMNTGLHDALNLGWKLSGVLGGLYSEDILDTYTPERRSSAERMMNLDKDIAALISGKIPDHFHAPLDADPNDYLAQVFSANAMFTTGLGISYDTNRINRLSTSHASTVEIGHRAPDGPLFRSGRAIAQPLRTFIGYTGGFWVIVFSGKLEDVGTAMHLNSQCASNYRVLRAAIDSQQSFFNTRPASWNFLTILSGQSSLPASQAIGALPLGKTLYDSSGEVYAKYGVNEHIGAIVVLRPDGIVSFKTTLDGSGGQQLDQYFTSLASHRIRDSPTLRDQERSSTGYELDVQGEDPVQVLV